MSVAWHELDACQWRDAVGATSVVEGVEASLRRIAELDAELNAFTVVLADEARARAAELDALPPSERGPLHGVPVAIKDENDVAGTVTSLGTACNSSVKAEDSLTVRRLRDAGAVIIGKTAMPAFGAFPFTESQAFGVTRHPLDVSRTPGGSSGGSAVAVASGMVPLALGGDGGGSVRIPADRCGLVGFKPARGVVPTAPYEHLWHDLGTAGPLARSARDARLMYEVIAGLEPAGGERNLHRDSERSPLRIAVNVRPSSPVVRLDAVHRRAVWEAAQRLRGMGHEVVFVDSAPPDPTLPFVVQFFAGMNDEIDGLEHPERLERLHRFTRVVGAWAVGPVLSWARRAGEGIGRRLESQYFEAGFDAVLTPTTAGRPGPAGRLASRGFVGAMIASLPSVAYTLLWNVSGHPAIAVPVGKDKDGLPLSVQLVGSLNDQQAVERLFGLAAGLENPVFPG